jgi:hypothetical protein
LVLSVLNIQVILPESLLMNWLFNQGNIVF